MKTFMITDKDCAGCEDAVRAALGALDPQAPVRVDPVNQSVEIATTIPDATILAALKDAGYPANRMK